MREMAEIDDVDGSEPPIPAPIDDKSRFLTCRTKVNADNDYHRCHNPKSVAEIPELLENLANDEIDRDECIGALPTVGMLHDGDDERLKQELAHLPFDTTLRLLNHYNFDVDITIAAGLELVVPDVVPAYIKELFAANVAVERSSNPSRGLPYKRFYFAQELEKVATTQELVDLYYKQKNMPDSNWRLENEGGELDELEDKELEEHLRENGIEKVKSEPLPPRQTRYQKALATRRANQLRREGGSDDNASVSSPGTPPEPANTEKSPSPIGENEGSETSPRSVATSTRSSLENHTPPKKRRHRKSGEEHRVGPRRDYPHRKRNAPAFFE